MKELKALLERLQKDKAALDTKAEPFRKRLADAQAKMAPHELEYRKAHDALKEIEQPHKSNLDLQIKGIEKLITKAPAETPIAKADDAKK